MTWCPLRGGPEAQQPGRDRDALQKHEGEPGGAATSATALSADGETRSHVLSEAFPSCGETLNRNPALSALSSSQLSQVHHPQACPP